MTTASITTRLDAGLRIVEDAVVFAGVLIATYKSTNDMNAAWIAASATTGGKDVLAWIVSAGKTSGMVKAAKLARTTATTLATVEQVAAPLLPSADAAVLEKVTTDLAAAVAAWDTIYPTTPPTA